MPNKAFDRACKLCILRFVIHNKHLLFSWNFPFPDTTIYSIKIVEKRGHRITRARAHTHTNTHTIAKSSYLFTLWWHRCGGSRVIVCRLFVWNVRSAISSARWLLLSFAFSSLILKNQTHTHIETTQSPVHILGAHKAHTHAMHADNRVSHSIPNSEDAHKTQKFCSLVQLFLLPNIHSGNLYNNRRLCASNPVRIGEYVFNTVCVPMNDFVFKFIASFDFLSHLCE